MAIVFEDRTKLTEVEVEALKQIIDELKKISELGSQLSGEALDHIMGRIAKIEIGLFDRLGEVISVDDLCEEGVILTELLNNLVPAEEWDRLTEMGMKGINVHVEEGDKEALTRLRAIEKPGRKN